MWEKAEEFLSKDKYIGVLVKKYGRCTLKPRKKKDYFEDLVDAIVQQQLSLTAAATIFKRLKDLLGGEVVPEKILRKNDETLRKCGLSFAKIKYIKDLSEKVVSNKLQVTRLDRLTDEEVMEELIAVKGIGKWTSDMFLIFTLARPDVFPVEDLGIRSAIKILLKKEIKPDTMIKVAQRWSPWRTVASWYLWKLLDG